MPTLPVPTFGSALRPRNSHGPEASYALAPLSRTAASQCQTLHKGLRGRGVRITEGEFFKVARHIFSKVSNDRSTVVEVMHSQKPSACFELFDLRVPAPGWERPGIASQPVCAARPLHRLHQRGREVANGGHERDVLILSVPPTYSKAGTCSDTNVKEDTAGPHPPGTPKAVHSPHCVVQVVLQMRAQGSKARACLEERHQVRVRAFSKEKLAYHTQYKQNFSLGDHSEQGNGNRKTHWRLVLHTAAKKKGHLAQICWTDKVHVGQTSVPRDFTFPISMAPAQG